VVRIGRPAHEITTGGCLEAKYLTRLLRTCAGNQHSMSSVCTRWGERAEIGQLLRSVYRKSAVCAFYVHTQPWKSRPLAALRHLTGGSDRAPRARDNHRRMPGSEISHTIAPNVCRKSAFYEFCVYTLGRKGENRTAFAERVQEIRSLRALYAHARKKVPESGGFDATCTENPQSAHSMCTRSHGSLDRLQH
jgi:hypothetical protein